MKKLILFLILSFFFSGKAFAEKLPKFLCETIDNGEVIVSNTFDFNLDPNAYNLNIESELITYHYRVENSVIFGGIDRSSGFWEYTVVFDSGEKYDFDGECKIIR